MPSTLLMRCLRSGESAHSRSPPRNMGDGQVTAAPIPNAVLGEPLMLTLGAFDFTERVVD
jgi:hypothetical protein